MQEPHDPAAGHLEVRHLRLVQAVAREESVTRAAVALHLSQSAVSHQLVDLERELGARLFDRVGKRMVLTAGGARALEVGARLLTELCSLERELRAQGRDARVPLRVTTSCYTSYHWLPAALQHFTVKHPRVELSIVLEATRRAVEALAADEVDLAIVNAPLADETFACDELLVSELCVLARPDHQVLARGAAKRGTVRWGDLRGATVLVHDVPDQSVTQLQAAVRESWERKSGERLANPVEVRKIPLTEAIVELARAGVGVAIVDRWIADGYLGHGGVEAYPFSPRASRSFHALHRRANPRGLPMDELLRVISRHALRRAP